VKRPSSTTLLDRGESAHARVAPHPDRRAGNCRCRGLSAEARGPTSSPQADLRRFHGSFRNRVAHVLTGLVRDTRLDRGGDLTKWTYYRCGDEA
jgi:hypothetical protein